MGKLVARLMEISNTAKLRKGSRSRREAERTVVKMTRALDEAAQALLVAEEAIRKTGELAGMPEDKIQEMINVVGQSTYA